jgi:hypothetical protein
MSIFKVEKNNRVNRIDDVIISGKDRSKRKLDNILLDVSDDSNSGRSSTDGLNARHRNGSEKNKDIRSKHQQNGGVSLDRSSRSRQHKHREESNGEYSMTGAKTYSRYRSSVLPNILDTESIEHMLTNIEHNLSAQDIFSNISLNSSIQSHITQNGGYMTQHIDHNIEPNLMKVLTTDIHNDKSENKSDYSITEKINNSLIQEIDMLVYKIQSEY